VEFFNAFVSGRREEGVTPVSNGERSTRCGTAPGSRAERRQEDAAASSRSRAAYGLTRGGRQSVKPVGAKDCLDQILFGDQIGCRNGMAWERGILWLKKIMEKNLGCCNLNKKNQTFELKTEEIRIKQSFGIFSKLDILRFGWKDSKFKGENGI
jgi:hypothetical protein